MREYDYRADREFGDWTLIRPLGHGGNGEVWLARNRNGDEGAIKIGRRLGSPDSERYQRFVNELRFNERLGGRPGVLPVVDSFQPERSTHRRDGPPWLVMPVAIPIRQHFGTLPDVREVVGAIAEIADALTQLAIESISHRDVKPENVYQYRGRFAIGDFGLVDVPGQETLTQPGRSLGPWGFLAPEMMTSADTADGRMADVFSLAKTLWVLATGQTFPPSWQIRADDPRDRLQGQISGPRLYLLDRLIESATGLDPTERPSMAAFRDDLQAWLEGPSVTDPAPDLSDLAHRLIGAISNPQREIERRAELSRRAGETVARLARDVNLPILNQLRKYGFEKWIADPPFGALLRQFAPPGGAMGDPDTLLREARGFTLRAPAHDGGLAHVLYGAFVVTLLSDGNVELAAHYLLAQELGASRQLVAPRTVAEISRRVPVGTAVEDNAVSEIAALMYGKLETALQAFVEAAEA